MFMSYCLSPVILFSLLLLHEHPARFHFGDFVVPSTLPSLPVNPLPRESHDLSLLFTEASPGLWPTEPMPFLTVFSGVPFLFSISIHPDLVFFRALFSVWHGTFYYIFICFFPLLESETSVRGLLSAFSLLFSLFAVYPAFGQWLAHCGYLKDKSL